MKDNAASSWYLVFDTESVGDEVLDTFLNILTFIILLNNLIPIRFEPLFFSYFLSSFFRSFKPPPYFSSLIVSMEVVKFQLGSFIDNDLAMYYAPNNTPASARTSSLIEELGQVEYVFSDKTGTLTENKMLLKKISVGGLSYVDDASGDSQPTNDHQEQSAAPENDTHGLNEIEMESESAGVQANLTELNFDNMLGKLKLDQADQQRRMVHLFLTMMAVCHTVIPEEDPKKPGGMSSFMLLFRDFHWLHYFLDNLSFQKSNIKPLLQTRRPS